MIIPTYWSTPDLPSWKVFDHPTSIFDEGTLGRTLDNLEQHAYSDPVILFPAPSDPRIEEKVKRIAAERSLDMHVYSSSDLNAARSALQKSGFPKDLLGAIDLNSYGSVRNLGLLHGVLQGFDNVVMIDDDECIDEGYHAAALRHMGPSRGDCGILGKTGCVIDANGRRFYDGQASHTFENWPKDELFNETVRIEMEAEGPLSVCTVAFGGNMVLNRKMFLQVPFDPYGTRGEDDDYVLNARYCGLPFYFDKNFTLLHLPPQRQGGFWTRHRQDILRFKYTREKIRLFKFEPESLGTFLSYFTQDDLEFKIVSSSIHAARYFVDRDREEFEEFLNNAMLAESLTVPTARTRAETFLRFLDAWQTILPGL